MITYPLNNIDYTAEDAELYFSTRESGVYDGGNFEATVSGIDNDVTVGTGIAWIHNTKFSGKVVALKETKILTLSLPNSVYDRIDSIVIQFDANKNATDVIVKEGIASSVPVAPAVVKTESLYELHIFHVIRHAGATAISPDDITDLRNNRDYCGVMFDPISSIDENLSKRGFAADAKATGDAIKNLTANDVGAAPSGYGLGERVGRYCADCLAVTEGGLYYVDNNTANKPPEVGGGALLVQPIDVGYGVDIYLTVTCGETVWRRYYSTYWNTWQPWECENPPMNPGLEYRTTKRYYGKPVYTKLLSYAPSSFVSQNIRIPHEISNLGTGISISVSWDRDWSQWRHFPSVYYADAAWNGAAYWAGSTELYFELGESLRQNMQNKCSVIFVTVEYTKAT